MAELIPLGYQVRVASRRRVERWVFAALLVAVACVTSLVLVYAWKARTAAEVQTLCDEYQRRSVLITRSQDLRGKRQDLATRMQTIQQLMDDKVLLTLLRNVAESFSTNDSLEYIHVDARGSKKGGPGEGDGEFVVRITGITNNATTLAELMTRLSKQQEPAVNLTLELSRRENFLDGQVMRFQITCERAVKKG